MSYALLTIIANASLGRIPTGPDAAFPQWNGPDPTIVHVQTVLYTSLAASLLAAFIAMLGKQWLNRFAQLERHGSITDRSRHRVRKFQGMVTWHFDLVMESLPLMLQAALLLLGYALSDYLFFINKAISGIIIGFTSFGLLFYLLVVSAATLSYTCPFQTPPSLIIRFMVRFDDEHRKYLKRFRRWIGAMFYRIRKLPKGGFYPLGGSSTYDGNDTRGRIELTITGPSDGRIPPFDKPADWNSYALDSDCIMRMFEISTDTDVIQANLKLISEIIWHAGIRTTPLNKVYDTILECLDYSTGRPVVVPRLRNQAYLGAKALLHLAIQRLYICGGSDVSVLAPISERHQIIGSQHYEGDSDLESILDIIDCVLGHRHSMSWQNFSPTASHHAWMAHTLLYRAWDALRSGGPLPGDIRDFVLHSLQLDPPPSSQVLTDCLLVIDMVLGAKLHLGDLLVVDKRSVNTYKFLYGWGQIVFCSNKFIPQIRGEIYEKVFKTFSDPDPTAGEIDHTLEAMELIAPLAENDIATKSYDLFRVVMQTPLSYHYAEEKKWKASRLAMSGAYKWDKFLPWVEDPKEILTFLDYHFDLVTQGDEDHDQPIQYALRALAYASSPVTIEALKNFDPTPSFIRGICYAFQDDKQFQLRKAALFFLPLIGDRLFNTAEPIMDPGQMRSLCVDWASAVDGIEHTYDVQKAALAVLFGMMNSSHWRPHIVTGKWKLLEYFSAVPDDSQPLKRCLENPELTDAISQVNNPAAMVLWLAILWLKYNELMPEVREQLEAITKTVAQGTRRPDLDMYMSLMDSELAKAEDALGRYGTWSVDPAAVALRVKVNNLQEARAALLALKRG